MVATCAPAQIHGPRRSRFFVVMSVVLLLLVLTGSSQTFYLRAFFDAPAIPVHVYVHGSILTAWFVCFVMQTSIAHVGRVDLHRPFGIVGALLGGAVAAANVWVLTNSAANELTAYYGAHGYPLARAYLPEQEIQDGVAPGRRAPAFQDRCDLMLNDMYGPSHETYGLSASRRPQPGFTRDRRSW